MIGRQSQLARDNGAQIDKTTGNHCLKWFFALAWLVLLVLLSIGKSFDYGQWAWGNIERFLGGDLQMHFVMAFVLSLLTHRACPQIYHRGLLLLLIAGCAVDECLQLFLPLRSFNLLDFFVTFAGLFLAALPFMVARRWVANSTKITT